MTIAKALRLGVQALYIRKRLWLWFYAVTTIWALAVAGPAIGLLFAALGQSASAERMAGNFDLQWVSEFIAERGALPFVPWMVAASTVFVIAAVAHLFLLGGAVQLFCAREGFYTAPFFQGCGKHFWRFVRLALVSAPFYVAVVIVRRVLDRIGDKIWGEGSEQTPLVYWGWASMAIFVALLGLMGLIFDYARIRVVATDSRKTIRATLASIRFVFANFRRTAGLYLALWIIAAALLAAYNVAAGVVTQTSLGLVILLFVARQAMVLAKGWTQLLFYASQSEMYQALAPIPIVVVTQIVAEPAPEPAAEEPAPEPEPVVEPEPVPDVPPEP